MSFVLFLVGLSPATASADETCDAWLDKSHHEKVLFMAEGNQVVLDVLLHAKRTLIDRRSSAENIAAIDRQISAMLACQQRGTPKLIANWDAICRSQENTLRNLEIARDQYGEICTKETVQHMPQ